MWGPSGSARLSTPDALERVRAAILTRLFLSPHFVGPPPGSLCGFCARRGDRPTKPSFDEVRAGASISHSVAAVPSSEVAGRAASRPTAPQKRARPKVAPRLLRDHGTTRVKPCGIWGRLPIRPRLKAQPPEIPTRSGVILQSACCSKRLGEASPRKRALRRARRWLRLDLTPLRSWAAKPFRPESIPRRRNFAPNHSVDLWCHQRRPNHGHGALYRTG